MPRPAPATSQHRLTGPSLTEALVGLGMRFSGAANREPAIEDVLESATEAGMEDDDLRVLDVLTTWVSVHGAAIHAALLERHLDGHASHRVRAYWASIAGWPEMDSRGLRLRHLTEGEPREPLLRVGNEFQVDRRGEDLRFRGAPLIVRAGVFRYRSSDVASPEALARTHAVYRERLRDST